MSLKFVVNSLPTQCFFTNHLKHKTVNKTTGKSIFSISSPAISTLVEELSNCYDYFLRLSGSIWKSVFDHF